MEIDQVDLKIVRRIENHGLHNPTVLARRLDMPAGLVEERLKILRSARIIKGYGVSLFYPPLLGGEWFWALAQMETKKPLDYLMHQFPRVTKYVSDVAQHRCLPIGYCPNVTMLFYTQDLKRSMMNLKRTRGIDYVEVYRISKYSFPVKRELSKIEQAILNDLARSPEMSTAELAESTKLSEREVSAKLDNLLWDEENKGGIALVLPNLDWTKVTNFTHIHVGLETALPETKLVKLLKTRGIDTVPYAPWFKKKYFQVESDIWNLGQLTGLFNSLAKIKKISVMGLVMARAVKILDGAKKEVLGG